MADPRITFTITASETVSTQLAPFICPDACPVCGYDLKSDGYPIAHQSDPDGATCEFEWDYARQREIERAEDAREGYES